MAPAVVRATFALMPGSLDAIDPVTGVSMRARRSSLSVPGSSERMLGKAIGLPVDEVVADLEDSVAADAKEHARELVRAFLAQRRGAGPGIAVRINPLTSPWGERDVIELVGPAPSLIGSVIVPKVERAADVAAAQCLLDELGPQAAGVGVQALIETASGLGDPDDSARCAAAVG